MAADIRVQKTRVSEPTLIPGRAIQRCLVALLFAGPLFLFPAPAWSGPPEKGSEPKRDGKASTKAVDIVFVVDATGSMEPHIKNLRESTGKFAEAIADAKIDARFAVTIFRDRVDTVGNKPEDPLSLKVGDGVFSNKIEEFSKLLADVKAEGGGDFPESSFDALDFSSRLEFRTDARKVLILLTDAPPRIPDKDIKDDAHIAKILQDRGIDQVHVFHDLEPERYRKLQTLLGKGRGRAVSLFPGGLDAMQQALADMAGDIAGFEPPVIAKEGAKGPMPAIPAKVARVDVVFVVDTTGSMGGDLTSLRDQIGAFISELRESKTDFQIGVVTFKDRAQDPAETKEPRPIMFGGKEFTTDADALSREIGNLKADGGGDDPESGLDALEFATRRPFRDGAARVLVLLSDAGPRIPDVDMKGHDQVAQVFKDRGIDQFHAIVRGNGTQYNTLSKLHGKGRFIDLGVGGASFRDGLQSIAADAVGGVFIAGGKEVVKEREKGKEPEEKLSEKIDLVFVVDTTGSMDAALRNLRDHVGRFTQVFKEAKKDIRVSVVSFSDRVDEPPPNNEHKALKFSDGAEFSRDPDELGKEIGKLSAFGGGDAPESGLDALEFASRREFRKDARKVFVLITDEGPRVPDKDMKDEDQVAQLLKERGVETLHLLVGDNSTRYEKLSKMLAKEGRRFDINRGGGEGFKASLEEMARTTISGDKLVDRKLPIAGSKVDLVFLIDTTGSMSDFAGALQRPAEQLHAKLIREKVDVRMCLITFRDRHPGDGNAPEDHKIVQIEGKEFSSSLEELRRSIGTLRADQGGDAPESSLDALAFGAKRDFRFDALKVIVLITDEGPKVPDKDMKDENDVLRIFKDKGIHQLHLIAGNNAERYFTLQRLMGKDGKVAGKSARIGERGNDTFTKSIDEMAVAMLDQLRTEGRVRLTDKPLPPLKLAKNEKDQGMVDVMFVLDVTASMGPEIAMVRDHAPKIVKKLQDLNLDVRLGLTTFRDRVDMTGNTPEDPKALMFKGDEFTANMEDFQREVGSLKAKEGGDAEESSLDALEYASRRSFRKGAYKVLILVTDAPPRLPDKDMKDEFQVGELLRERGINQLHLLLKTEPHRYVTMQRFLTNDGAQAGLHYDLGTIGRTERMMERLMDSLSRSMAGETRRGLSGMAKREEK